jgi:hypothetical protein
MTPAAVLLKKKYPKLVEKWVKKFGSSKLRRLVELEAAYSERYDDDRRRFSSDMDYIIRKPPERFEPCIKAVLRNLKDHCNRGPFDFALSDLADLMGKDVAEEFFEEHKAMYSSTKRDRWKYVAMMTFMFARKPRNYLHAILKKEFQQLSAIGVIDDDET